MEEIRCDLCDKVVENQWSERNPFFTGCVNNGPPCWDKSRRIINHGKEIIDKKECVVCENCKNFNGHIKSLMRKEVEKKRAKERLKEIDEELKELESQKKPLEQEAGKLRKILAKIPAQNKEE